MCPSFRGAVRFKGVRSQSEEKMPRRNSAGPQSHQTNLYDSETLERPHPKRCTSPSEGPGEQGTHLKICLFVRLFVFGWLGFCQVDKTTFQVNCFSLSC